MVTSGWIDLADIVAGQDGSTIDNSGPTVQPDFFPTSRTTQDDAYTRAATYRWGVVIVGDGLLKLQLQGLHAAAAWLSGRHQFQGYPAPVI